MTKIKTSAIKLIKLALSEGWKRKVFLTGVPGYPKCATTVSLTIDRNFGAIYRRWAHIMVTFRNPSLRGRRESVSYRVHAEYYPRNGQAARCGKRNAYYQIQRMKEELARDARYAESHPV